MIEWLKTLELETIIIFGFLLVGVLLLLIILIKTQRTINLIGKRALVLVEDLVVRDGTHVIDIVASNSSYVNVEAAAMGLIYKDKLLPLKEETTIVLARDSYKVTLSLDQLRIKVLGKDKKIKMIYVYVEDALGRRTIKHAYNAYNALKKILKDEKKAYKKELKRERFETGNYRIFERVGLVFKWIFSPFVKLYLSIAKGVNRRLKEREIKQDLKRKEREHQDMLREVALDEKREQERADLEKRIKEEQLKANLEARKQALKRKEEARKLEDELKKSEEELVVAEAEAALYEEKLKAENEEKDVENELDKDTDVVEPTQETALDDNEIVDVEVVSEVEDQEEEKEISNVEESKKPQKKTSTMKKKAGEVPADLEEKNKEEDLKKDEETQTT